MNKRQLEVLKLQIRNEKKIIQLLKRVYQQASLDCERKIRELAGRTDMENLQSIIYQKQYQEALKKQLDGILDELQNKEFENIAEYLTGCYEDGFLGTLYDLHGQGIPFIFPIDQGQVVQAIQVDSKISTNLYTRLGEDVVHLKKSIRAELSRGISNGSMWAEMAAHIAHGMNSPFRKAMNYAMRIARTEGHRIQNQAQMDTLNKAKENGADVVKQWCSTLDARTRDSHKLLDGQIREIEDYFEVNGHRAKYPGGFGIASEDIHCRCCMLQRAKWALDQDELDTLKDRAAYFGLDKTKDFADFKDKYLHLPDNADTMKVGVLDVPVKSKEVHYDALLTKLKSAKIVYNPVQGHVHKVTDNDIISALSGGDNTSGSCASVALAYIGQKQQWNVFDFRDGDSREFFSSGLNLYDLSEADGMKSLKAEGKCSLTVGNRLLKQCEEGKEYFLCVGRHVAIVRKKEGVFQYLELQSATRSGWTNFDKNARHTLNVRFGCTSSSDHGISSQFDFMLDISESDFATDDFKSLLGYINTAENEQRKGSDGTIK